jgi:hypothetical protein
MRRTGRRQNRRLLLVSGIVPCSNYSGGLFLQQIIKMTGPLAGIFALQNRTVFPDVDDEIGAIATRIVERPNDGYEPDDDAEQVRSTELANEIDVIPGVAAEVLAFAREVDATDLWVVLEGQSLIRLARALSTQSDMPLRVQVMDPPGWWLRAHNLDAVTARSVLKQFDDVMGRARICSAASWAMARNYGERYGIETVAVVPPIDLSLARMPAERPRGDGLRIGFAGQVYALEEFSALRLALEALSDEGRHGDVSCHAYTNYIGTGPDPVVRIHRWLPQSDLLAELADADLLYCPYWFAAGMREEANLSFPSKLTSYIAAGRPVLFHGRADSSPARFLRQNGAAFFCFRPSVAAVKETIVRAVSDDDTYARTARAARSLLETYLSADALRQSFARFCA